MANVLLRMPDALLKRIDAARAKAEQEAGWPIDRTAFLLRVITRALIAMEQEPAPELPEAQTPATAPIAPGVEYDTTRHYLGQLCSRGHDYQGAGQSLRRKSSHQCVQCDKELAAERRQAKRQR